MRVNELKPEDGWYTFTALSPFTWTGRRSYTLETGERGYVRRNAKQKDYFNVLAQITAPDGSRQIAGFYISDIEMKPLCELGNLAGDQDRPTRYWTTFWNTRWR